VQKSREDGRTLFSITYFAAFLKYTYGHFLETVNKPFDFIRALRIYNPITPNLAEHLLNFSLNTCGGGIASVFGVYCRRF